MPWKVMRRSPRDILASLKCDVDNYRFPRRRANRSAAVWAESDICKASYTASQKAESLLRGHITFMLSKFEVSLRFGALVSWDTFRRGAEGLHWSARGESRWVRTSRLKATQNKAALRVQWTIRSIYTEIHLPLAQKSIFRWHRQGHRQISR